MDDREQQRLRRPSFPPEDTSLNLPSSSSSSSSSYSSSSSSSSNFSKTFYRRRLPSTSISFSSPEGRDIFASAFSAGGTYALFPLIEQLQTQPEPSYCGLTTLVIILNALAVDPRRSWKGPWRWYEESMLNCCVDLEQVKKAGITFGTFACLAKCQGLAVNAVYGSNSTVEDFRRIVKRTCTEPVASRRRRRSESFLVVSYTRSVVGQTGTGHFSPVGAYDEASDHVLILDTARFKYGPHWMPLQLMFDALQPFDPDTGKSRGYAVLSYDRSSDISADNCNNARSSSPLPISVLFGSKKAKDYLRREYKTFLCNNDDKSSKGVDLQSVVSFWTKNHTQINFVWELVEPQLIPVDPADVELVMSVRRLLRNLIETDKDNSSDVIPPDMLLASRESVGDCCKMNSHIVRALDISPGEALYVIYLASLPLDLRLDVVNENSNDDDDISTAKKQLLAEAALISLAIETCDAEA